MDYALDYTVGGLEPARRYKFYPNRSATRAEVFAFAKNILNVKNGTDGYCEIDGIKVKEPCKIS